MTSKLPNFKQYASIKEGISANKNPTVLVLTSQAGKQGYPVRIEESKEDKGTVERLQDIGEEKNIDIRVVDVDEAFAIKGGTKKLIIYNHDGNNKRLAVDIPSTICIARGNAIRSRVGKRLLEIIENCGILCIDSSSVMKVCTDKLTSFLQMKRHGIPTVKTAYVPTMDSIDRSLEFLDTNFPIIMKVNRGSAGVGVMKSDKYDDYVSTAQTLINKGVDIVVQPYIPHNFDTRIMVIDGNAVAATKRIRSKQDFRTNIHQGGSSEPHKPPKFQLKLAERASRKLGVKFGAIDIINDGKRSYVLEVNSSPGTDSRFYSITEGEEISGKVVLEELLNHFIS